MEVPSPIFSSRRTNSPSTLVKTALRRDFAVTDSGIASFEPAQGDGSASAVEVAAKDTCPTDCLETGFRAPETVWKAFPAVRDESKVAKKAAPAIFIFLISLQSCGDQTTTTSWFCDDDRE